MNKNVLIVTTCLNTGGAEVVLVDLVTKLKNNGYNIRVLNLKNRGSQYYRLISKNIKVYEVDKRNYLRILLSSIALLLDIYRFKPKIIQGWMYHGNLVASIISALQFKRPMWSIHHSLVDINLEKKSLRKLIRILKLISIYPKKIHYCSNTSKLQHNNIGYCSRNSVIIHNGVDIEKYRNNNKRINDNVMRIGHIARYHPMKDHSNLLKAIHINNNKINKKIKYVLAGNNVDSNNNELSDEISRYGINNIELLGEVNNIPKLLSHIDIFCTSSAWGESFPIVLLEAMSCAIPCIATNLGDCSYLIDSTGIIVEPMSPEALSNALEELISISDEDRIKLGQRARDRVINNFTTETMVQKFIIIYEK